VNTTLTQAVPAPQAPAPPVAAPAGPVAANGRRIALILMTAGVTVAVAAVALFATVGANPSTPAKDSTPAPAAASTTAITIGGTDDVAVHRMGYGPYESSTWHRHSGMHAIAVLSGTLTIYGPDCQPARFGPGQSYVGGQGLHLARNESDEPVEMSVTYLFPDGVPLQNFVIPSAAPAGCAIS
jgi:hypothetical protein